MGVGDAAGDTRLPEQKQTLMALSVWECCGTCHCPLCRAYLAVCTRAEWQAQARLRSALTSSLAMHMHLTALVVARLASWLDCYRSLASVHVLRARGIHFGNAPGQTFSPRVQITAVEVQHITFHHG